MKLDITNNNDLVKCNTNLLNNTNIKKSISDNNTNIKIGIIGNCFVGKATQQLKCDEIDIIVYDNNPNLCIPYGTMLEDVCKTDILFISVPTPMNNSGSYYLDILKSVISEVKNYINLDDSIVVIRSTVPPDTSEFIKLLFYAIIFNRKKLY